MSERDATLFVFAKPPAAGRSKTRLAVFVGDDAARDLADAFLRDTWRIACAVPGARAVLATTTDAEAYGLGASVPSVPQGDGDLGGRMARVLSRALCETPKALVLGTDCPGISTAQIRGAMDALDSHDACLAPTRDGGFYLLAMRRCEPDLLDDLPWSTAAALGATRARLERRGYTASLGEPWFDVDVARDLDHVVAAWPSVATHAPETAAALLRLGLVEATDSGIVRRRAP